MPHVQYVLATVQLFSIYNVVRFWSSHLEMAKSVSAMCSSLNLGATISTIRGICSASLLGNLRTWQQRLRHTDRYSCVNAENLPPPEKKRGTQSGNCSSYRRC